MAESAAKSSAASNNADAGRPSSAQSRYLNDPEEIVQVVELLRDLRAELQLRFDEERAVFTARVLDLQGSVMLIEDVQPREGMRLLRSGKPFSLSMRGEGLYVHSVHNQAQRASSEHTAPCFHVPLPKSLLFQQRRRAVRYRLPLRVTIAGARLTLFPEGRESKPLTGTLIDISSGGCRAEFEGFKFCPIQEGDPLDRCLLQVPRMLDLTIQGEIRHSQFDPQQRLLTCGIEFVRMADDERQSLERFIERMSGTTSA